MDNQENSLSTDQCELMPTDHALMLQRKKHIGQYARVINVWLKKKSHSWFCVLVLIPWLGFACYWGWIKTPEYESVVNVLLGQPSVDAMGAAPLMGLFNKSKQMAIGAESGSLFLIQKYIYSQQMLSRLQNTLDIEAHFQSKRIDKLSRLANNLNQQKLLDYYLKKVKVTSDPSTGELIIAAKAFSPQKAQEMANFIEKSAAAYFKQLTLQRMAEQSTFVETKLNASRNKVIQLHATLNALANNDSPEMLPTIEAKRLELKFAEAEYDAAQQAYVIWNMATHHTMPITSSPASLPDNYVSPKLPHDLINALLVLMLIYFLGYMVVVLIREHTD